VLLAMGLTPEEARSTLRLSLGWTTTAQEIEAALRILPPLVERVRREIPG
jgi:cysteine desulfurase